MRLFIAIEVPEEIKERVYRAIEPVKALKADVRWVTPAGFHLTLKFLGEVDERGLEEVKAALGGLSAILPATGATTMRVQGAGAFPGLKNPRVVWIGAEEPSGQLAAIQSDLESRLEAQGFPREDRPFHPHLTVGRVKSSKRTRELADGLSALKGLLFGEFPLEEVVLFKSDLKPAGAVYTKLFTVDVTEKRE